MFLDSSCIVGSRLLSMLDVHCAAFMEEAAQSQWILAQNDKHKPAARNDGLSQAAYQRHCHAADVLAARQLKRKKGKDFCKKPNTYMSLSLAYVIPFMCPTSQQLSSTHLDLFQASLGAR